MMAGIRGSNTRPERMVRSALHARGLRFRLGGRGLPGRPDLVFPRFSAVVFVHGCFWHRHVGCRYATVPKTRPAFWAQKFDENVERDRRVEQQLHERGWNVHLVWECALRDDAHFEEAMDALAAALRCGAPPHRDPHYNPVAGR